MRSFQHWRHAPRTSTSPLCAPYVRASRSTSPSTHAPRRCVVSSTKSWQREARTMRSDNSSSNGTGRASCWNRRGRASTGSCGSFPQLGILAAALALYFVLRLAVRSSPRTDGTLADSAALSETERDDYFKRIEAALASDSDGERPSRTTAETPDPGEAVAG